MPSVIAAAASVVDDPGCREDLAGDAAFVVALTAPPEVLARRLAADDSGERREIAGQAPDRTARFREVADVEIDASDDDRSVRDAAALAALPPGVLAGGPRPTSPCASPTWSGRCASTGDGLGFTPTHALDAGPEFGTLMELDGVALRSQFLRRDGVRWSCSLHVPARRGRRCSPAGEQAGVHHLSVRVPDVDAAARVAQTGGSVLDATRTTFGDGDGLTDFVYCTDRRYAGGADAATLTG